jgi:hypothetical protein
VSHAETGGREALCPPEVYNHFPKNITVRGRRNRCLPDPGVHTSKARIRPRHATSSGNPGDPNPRVNH